MSLQTRAYGEIFQLVDEQLLNRLITWGTLGLLASWIGFAIYVHVRRDYFRPREDHALLP